MTSITAIPSLFQCATINQNGGNTSNFKVLQKKEELTKNKNVFAEVLEKYDKKFDTKTRKGLVVL